MTAEEIRRQNQKLIQQQQAQNAAVRAASQAPTQTAAQKALNAYTSPATASPVGAVSPAKQSGGVVTSKASSAPTPYEQALNAYSSGYPEVNKLEPVNYDTVQYRGDVDGGFQEADDAFKQSWAQIQAAYNAGDEATARELINQLQGGGNFMGWYDDNGAYNGFVRGFGGAGNGSYQAMIGGKMAQSGNVDTDWWLTPQGNIMSGKPGDALADTGNTWSYADQRVQSLAPTGANTNAPGAAGLTGKVYRPSSATDPAQFVQTAQKSTQTATQTTPQTQQTAPQTAELVTDSRQLSAPEAYDPESDSLWQQYLSDYQGEKAPEWDETFDYAQTPEYQRYLAEWDRAQAPEYEGSPYDAMRDEALERAKGPFAYDLELDPVWQSYRKQYTREGRRASEDTMGQYAAMTGGMPSTAAMTAAQQAGNYYSAQMADKVPQLYQDAYQRYLNEYQKQLGLAGEYNQYGQQDYNRFRDRLGQWNTDRSFNYGAAQDAIGNRRADYGQRYNQFQDALSQWNTDRSFNYGAARDNQALGRQQVEDQYGRYRDAVSDQRYDQEWAQQLREYADSQNWKATEWQQYLREYGDKLSQQEREWAYQQMRDAIGDERYGDETAYQRAMDAWEMGNTDYDRQWKDAERRAQYGDYSGMRALLGDQFDAWLQDQQSQETPAAASTYRYTGGSSGSGSSGGETGDYLAQLKAAGITTYNGALSWLAMNAGKLSDTKSKAIAQAFMESLGGDQGTSFSDSDINWARDIMTSAASGKVDVTSDAYKMAQMILSGSGWQFGTGGEAGAAEQNQGAAYNNLAESLDRMAGSGRSRDEIYAEIDAEVKDGRITKEQGAALKERYYGQVDNVANSGTKHANGLPQSTGFNRVMQEAESKATRGSDQDSLSALADFLMEQYNTGKIHEYEIDIILDRLESR